MLSESTRWEGPEWVTLEQDDWTKSMEGENREEILKESKKIVPSQVNTEHIDLHKNYGVILKKKGLLRLHTSLLLMGRSGTFQSYRSSVKGSNRCTPCVEAAPPQQ